MNILAFLTVLFGTTAIVLFYVLAAARDDAAGWRIYASQLQARVDERTVIGTLPPQPPQDWNTVTLDLLEECELLEQRNDWLEWRQVHCQALVASSIMLAPSRLGMGHKMAVKEGEAP